jgi:hypothetical protein
LSRLVAQWARFPVQMARHGVFKLVALATPVKHPEVKV